ncbi:YceI family protein [Pedobacter sp. L105]|uniref:YceI family protein n=1 Tax=Pedobacter sp. L105 TaxID=1641871 RepID=UPI00131B99C8|nr:YceI family protein [Pedobacter sp. L105]
MIKSKWLSDPVHSELGFKIRHLMISNVSGSFKDFQVQAETDGDDFSTASISLTAKIASLSTDDEQRDTHLKNSDFFDMGNHPELTFESKEIEKVDECSFILHGDLTMKGTTKPVSLNVEFGGLVSDPTHGKKAGFTITGKIKRSEWHINFNRVLDTGDVGLGEEVKIFSELQLLKQASS